MVKLSGQDISPGEKINSFMVNYPFNRYTQYNGTINHLADVDTNGLLCFSSVPRIRLPLVQFFLFPQYTNIPHTALSAHSVCFQTEIIKMYTYNQTASEKRVMALANHCMNQATSASHGSSSSLSL